MADSISAIPQQPQLGRIAQFLRYLETQNAPEFLPKQLDVMGLIRQLALPSASTVENLSYGNSPFTMPPQGTGAMIPQVKTGRKPEVADLVGMLGGVPGVGALSDVGTKLSNEAADAIVRAITGNPQATAPQVIRETSMPFMQAVAPKAPSLLESRLPAIETDNFKNWFGDWQASPEMSSKVVDDQGLPLVVYHGTQRPDRIGTQFRKSRATSGPMAFFTDNPELASSYATGKQDTSLAYEDTNYASWFKKKEGRSTLNLDQVGARMSSQEKQDVLDKLRRVGQDEQGNIVVGEGLVSDQTFDFMLKDPREGGGNPLRLANKLWLESGTLYGREEQFSDVLKAIGVKGFEQDFPTSTYPAVYPTYLDIKNPLDTSNIDERTLYALEYNAKKQRKPSGGGSDQWDKRRRDPQQWIDQLKEDMAEGKSSMVWTSIPDWVTKTLKAEGFDGIKDTGGKSGGTPHTVWIPFEENQVKSATGNVGTFSRESKNILRGAAPLGPAAGLLGDEGE
jgi:hypothetical protein